MNSLRLAGLVVSCSIALAAFQSRASAGPSLVVDAVTGRVLEQQDATRPWYPASLTKLLTIYIALTAVRDGRVSMNTPFVVSARAASMPPSKMGFKPGTEVTLDNALKMMVVKSANDLAVVIAEGLDGSVENFAADMNKTAAKLGLKDSHFVNPNGLPDPDHYSSARDLAIVARALLHDFPQYDWLYDIGAFQLGRTIIDTHNDIIWRYPGDNGMKTGFTCAAGLNLVTTVERGGLRLIVVVLGSTSAKARTLKAGALMDAAFENLFPTDGPTLEDLPKSPYAEPTDIHEQVCGRERPKTPLVDLPAMPPLSAARPGGLPPEAENMYSVRRPHYDPMRVFVGPVPGWSGPIAEAIGSPPPLPISAYAAENAVAGPLTPDPHALPLDVSRRKAVRRRVVRSRRMRRTSLRKQAAPRSRHAGEAVKSPADHSAATSN